MHIPSCTTPEEVLKYYTSGVPDWFVAEYEKLLDSKYQNHQDDIDAAVQKATDPLSEQLYFARELLEELMLESSDVMKECRKHSRAYKLAAFIKTRVDNSYFEM